MTYHEKYERDGYPRFPVKNKTVVYVAVGTKERYYKIKTRDPIDGSVIETMIKLQ